MPLVSGLSEITFVKIVELISKVIYYKENESQGVTSHEISMKIKRFVAKLDLLFGNLDSAILYHCCNIL